MIKWGYKCLAYTRYVQPSAGGSINHIASFDVQCHTQVWIRTTCTRYATCVSLQTRHNRAQIVVCLNPQGARAMSIFISKTKSISPHYVYHMQWWVAACKCTKRLCPVRYTLVCASMWLRALWAATHHVLQAQNSGRVSYILCIHTFHTQERNSTCLRCGSKCTHMQRLLYALHSVSRQL